MLALLIKTIRVAAASPIKVRQIFVIQFSPLMNVLPAHKRLQVWSLLVQSCLNGAAQFTGWNVTDPMVRNQSLSVNEE
jgi:hypothetical protein